MALRLRYLCFFIQSACHSLAASVALGCLARILKAKFAHHVAGSGIIGEVAGDKFFVANGLSNLDYSATSLGCKAKAPIRQHYLIAQFGVAVIIANAACAYDARGTMGTQHD